MQSCIVDTDAFTVTLYQNLYDGTGDDVLLRYRHGATPNACAVAAWNNYTIPFVSAGYVQVRLEATV
jgi:hypothetical protein